MAWLGLGPPTDSFLPSLSSTFYIAVRLMYLSSTKEKVQLRAICLCLPKSEGNLGWNCCKMLSKFTLRCTRYLIKGAQKLRISLFAWDDAIGQVEMTNSKLTWLVVVLMQFYLFGQFMFEVCQLCRLAGDPTEPLSNYMKLLMQWLTRSLGMIITVDSIFYGKNKAVFMNQILLLNRKFSGKWDFDQNRISKCISIKVNCKGRCPLQFGPSVLDRNLGAVSSSARSEDQRRRKQTQVQF